MLDAIDVVSVFNIVLCDILQALAGFLLVATIKGKILFVSENVEDYLGHSMVSLSFGSNSDRFQQAVRWPSLCL